MSGIIQTFLGNFIVAVMMWVLLCAILVGVFARERSGRFLVGMLRVLASLVYSPFVFIRNAIQGVIRSADGEADFAGSDQYLLNKLMLTLQAIVIVIAVASLAAGGVMTWNALVPPQWTRDRVTGISNELDSTKTKAAEATAEVAKADTEWQSSKKNAMASYVAKWQKIAEQRRTANAQLVPLINAASPNAAAIFSNVVVNAGSSVGDPDDTARRAQRMQSTVSSYYYYVDDITRSRLYAWIANWQQQQGAQYQASTVNETTVRAEVQPDYPRIETRKSELTSKVTSLEADLQAAKEEAALRWKAALWTFLRALVSFLVLVWILGVAVEGAWMVIRMASDVRRIREKATEDPAPVSAVGAATLTRERLPIRGDVPAADSLPIAT